MVGMEHEDLHGVSREKYICENLTKTESSLHMHVSIFSCSPTTMLCSEIR